MVNGGLSSHDWRLEGRLLYICLFLARPPPLPAALFVGGLPQLTDTSVVTEPAQRHLLSTVTTGTVLVELNVMCRDFLEAGVEFAAPKTIVEK